MSTERLREKLSRSITPELLEERRQEGWRPVAIEWERESVAGAGVGLTEVPFGLRVTADQEHLEEHPDEMTTLRVMLSQIVLDRPMSEVAEELNRRGLRRRGGQAWTQSSVFDLLPRLIEVAPTIYDSEQWQREKPRLRSVAG